MRYHKCPYVDYVDDCEFWRCSVCPTFKEWVDGLEDGQEVSVSSVAECDSLTAKLDKYGVDYEVCDDYDGFVIEIKKERENEE